MKNYYGLLILLCLTYSATGQIKFVIESLPEATPAQDSIFITGTFNNWNTTDPKCLLRKQPNGQLAVFLNFSESVVEYKFTRGDWLKVETGSENQYIPNRTLLNNGAPETIYIQIRNWQDLGGARNFEYLSFYYFGIAFLSLILFVLSFRVFKKELSRLRVFASMHGLLTLLYLGAVAYYVVNPIWQTYLHILGEVLFYLWGPLTYLFVKALTKNESSPVRWVYFAPTLFVALIVGLRLMNLDFLSFFSNYVVGLLTWGKLLVLGIGGAMTCVFLSKAILALGRKVKNRLHSFSRLVLLIHAICLCLVFVALFSDAFDPSTIESTEYKWLFVLFSFPILIEIIALWRNPQFFKEKAQVLHIDKADELLSKLKTLMEKDKVFHETELNVNRLAELMGTRSHILSKLLNEHFEQNFRDFVNGYRVKEFIDLAQEGRLEKLTYLGLAHEVGFNSKSTFNLAFKKITNKSPREYFKFHEV